MSPEFTGFSGASLERTLGDKVINGELCIVSVVNIITNNTSHNTLLLHGKHDTCRI